MNILIPVQYPLTDANVQAIRRGIELTDGQEDTELLIFYLNEVHKDRRITRQELREAVESAFEGLTANYIVRDGFFIEEAIVEAALELEMDHILLSEYRRNRWKQLLDQVLDLDQNPEQFIRDNTGIDVEVVTETQSDGTNE